MNHHAAPDFWVAYRRLSASVQRLADRAFPVQKTDPRHPSLHFKKVGKFWSVRVGLHHRTLGVEVDDGILWFWIGTHPEYDNIIHWPLAANGRSPGGTTEAGTPGSPSSPNGATIELMKRATVTIPDDLAEAVENFVRAQEARPPLTAVVQSALRQYLTDRGYLRARGPLQINPARKGSGRRDISHAHDRYLATR